MSNFTLADEYVTDTVGLILIWKNANVEPTPSSYSIRPKTE